MSTCKQCGESKTNLANHWRMSSDCDYPPLSEEQMDILTGIVMGDGTVDRSGANPRIKIEMVNEEYLTWLDNILGNMSTGVKHTQTAEESAKRLRESGFRPNADSSNYSDVYKLTTRRNPAFNRFSEWYDSGEKVIPELKLTPNILKNWYVCDGHLENRKNIRPMVSFGITNEYERSEKLEQMFIKAGIDANTTESKNLRIGVEHTEKFFDYIGSPVEGFKYKWPQA